MSINLKAFFFEEKIIENVNPDNCFTYRVGYLSRASESNCSCS